MRLIRAYAFEAAHQLAMLPDDHPCRRLHGHGYRFEVAVEGDVDERHMVLEYGELDRIVNVVLARYDHRFLNEFLLQPTVEAIAADIYGILHAALPAVASVRVWETERSSVVYP